MNTERQEKAKAGADLEHIEELKSSEAFRDYYLRRQNEELERRRERILHDTTLTKDQLWEERVAYLALCEQGQMMQSDEAGARAIVAERSGVRVSYAGTA